MGLASWVYHARWGAVEPTLPKPGVRAALEMYPSARVDLVHCRKGTTTGPAENKEGYRSWKETVRAVVAGAASIAQAAAWMAAWAS